MSQKLIIISAPSGAGKTTLVKHLLSEINQLRFSISCTTRNPRDNEENGKDYYFITNQEFEKKIETEQFVEYEEVYKNCYYGTLKTEIERIWNQQKTVIFDIDVQGGINIKNQFTDKALSVFIQPPSVSVLEQRLRARKTEDETFLTKRINKAIDELSYANKFDVILENNDLDSAKKEIVKIVSDFIKS